MRHAGVVFAAHKLDQLRAGHQTLVQFVAPGPGERLRIVHRDLDLERPIVHAPEPLGHRGCRGHRRTFFIQPAHVAETDSFDEQRVSVPFAGRVAEPPGLRIFRGQWAAVGEDLTQPVVGFIDDENESRSLNNFTRLRMDVKLHRMKRQAVRVGMILTVLRESLLAKVGGPGLERQTVGEQ